MKASVKSFAAGALTAALVIGCIATAAASYEKKTATLDYANIKIVMDGTQITPKTASGATVEPFAIDGTTYLPVRAVASAVGMDVSWDGSTSSVLLNTPDEKKATYITRTGSKYHYDPHCNGGTYWEVPFSTAKGMGLGPCDKCVLK